MSWCQQEWWGRGQFRQRIKEHLVTPPRRKCIPKHLLHQNPAFICPCLVCTDCQPLIILRSKRYTHSRMFLSWKQNSNTSWFGNGGYILHRSIPYLGVQWSYYINAWKFSPGSKIPLLLFSPPFVSQFIRLRKNSQSLKQSRRTLTLPSAAAAGLDEWAR